LACGVQEQWRQRRGFGLCHLRYGQLDRSCLRSSRPLATMDFLFLSVEKVTQIADQHKLASGR
jgi:hypothetical protein